jgi:hypothetical protein
MTAHEFLGILIQNYVDPHGVWKLMTGHEFLGILEWKLMNSWDGEWKLMNFCKWEMEIDEFLEFWNGN